MPKILRTPKNKYGLSIKQQMVIKDIVSDIKNNRPFNPNASHKKYYRVKNKASLSVITHENLNRPNFKEALFEALEYEGVLGVSGNAPQVLISGLNAYQIIDGEKVPDYKTRLKYIQEINKITGVYPK